MCIPILSLPKVDLNVRDSSGDTMALWALKNDKLEILTKLVGRVDEKVTDNNGDTLAKIAKYVLYISNCTFHLMYLLKI